MSRIILKFEKVTKCFEDDGIKKFIIKDANLCVEAGKIHLITGQSGIGKTTVLHLAGLLCQPDSGNVIIDGLDCNQDKLNTKIRRDKIGFVYQFHHLFPEFNVQENIALPLLVFGYKSLDIDAKVDEVLKALDITEIKKKSVAKISGGQKQRVAIARAVICNPLLLIADEPTGNLDAENSQKVFDLLCKISREKNCSVLCATHDSSLIKKADYSIEICNKALVKCSTFFTSGR